jgi:hypothetical protein
MTTAAQQADSADQANLRPAHVHIKRDVYTPENDVNEVG